MKRVVLFLLRGLARLPLRVLYAFSRFIYFIVYHLLGYRRKVVRQNLVEAFPEKSAAEIKAIEKEYYRYMCDIIVETVKLLHISDAEMMRRVEVVNPEEVKRSTDEGKSVVLLLAHYGNWEWVQEISRCLTGSAYQATIYHPLNSRLWDDIYREIRGRWAVNLLPQSKAVRTLLDAANRPWICGFIADHRPRTVTEDNIVPFLHHHTSFIYGPEVMGKKFGADFFFLKMERQERGRYRITFEKLEPVGEEPYPHTRNFWEKLEAVIKRNPAYWLWSHKRWKYDKRIEG